MVEQSCREVEQRFAFVVLGIAHQPQGLLEKVEDTCETWSGDSVLKFPDRHLGEKFLDCEPEHFQPDFRINSLVVEENCSSNLDQFLGPLFNLLLAPGTCRQQESWVGQRFILRLGVILRFGGLRNSTNDQHLTRLA